MKKRYLCLCVGAFATGIVLFDFNIIAFFILGIMLLIAGICFIFKSKFCPLVMAILFFAGGFYGNYEDLKSSPLEEYVYKPCSGQMYVTDIDLSDTGNNYLRVNAIVTEVNNQKINESVLLGIYGISDIKVNTVLHFDKLKFEIPSEARNDGSFNYNKYLKSKGIRYAASTDVKYLRASGTDGFVILKFFRTLKQQFTKRCEKIFGDSNAYGIIPAILVGSDILLSGEVQSLFSKAGITHILVASGMHVAVVVAILSMLLFPLRRKRWLYDTMLGVAVICFAMIVGYTPSMTRAVAAFFIYLIARRLLRSADPLTVLFEAMAVILLINPLSIFDLSFQLTFAAVSGIIMFTPHIAERFYWFVNLPKCILKLPKKAYRKLYGLINGAINSAAVSASAQLGVLPFIMNTFGGMGIFALFINVVIGLIIPLVYGFGIGAVDFNIEPFVTITKWLCDLMVKLAEITIKIPGNYLSLPQSNIVTCAMVCFVIICLLRCKIKKFTPFFEPSVFACAAVVVASCLIISYVPQDKAEITFLNVEQGDCAIIRLANNKTVVVDTGTNGMCDFEVIPYLARKNIHKIDYLFLSHDDDDHSGGLDLITEMLNVEKVVTGKASKLEIKNAEHIIVEKGDKINVGNAYFEILYAPEKAKNDNDSSVVMRMDFGKSSFLFTGDASKNIENSIENIDADVLKVSHHGAKNASTEEFLKKVSPKYSVISVEKNNTYGHPDSDTVERLKKYSSGIFRTDRDKNITITCDTKGNLKLTKRLQKAIINNRK